MKNTSISEDSAEVIITSLQQYFYKGNFNFSLNEDESKIFDWKTQEKFLNATVNSERVKKYPVSTEFVRLFLKKLLDYLENNNQEVHDELYTKLCNAMHQTRSEFCYRHYLIGNDINNIITIKETRNMVVNGTTGLKTWEAALMLSDWILCNKDVFANKNILELGSGVGFTGVTIGKLCEVKSLIFTDCHDDVLKTICDNIRINLPSFVESNSSNMIWFEDGVKSFGVTKLDWFDKEMPEIALDILIGADIVYDPSILLPLSDVIKAFCIRNPALEVYIASIIRNEETFREFLHTLEKMNLQYEEIKLSSFKFIEWDKSVNKCLLKITLNISGV